jgi:putative ABC transport system permease protein
MFTAFRLAIKSLFSNPVRTGLTTLGIIIGIGTVVLVLSAGAGFRSLVNSLLETYGTNTLFIETRVPPTTKNRNASAAATADFSRASSAIAVTSFKNRDLEEIKRLPNVVNDYGIVVGQSTVSYKDTIKNTMYYGASWERFNIDKSTLKAGRFYTVGEDTGADQVAILGSNLANDLFADQNPIGTLIRVGDLNFQVIGVYNPKGSMQGEDDIVFIPLKTAQKKLLGIDYLIVGIVQVKDTKLADATAEDIRAILRRNHNITDPYKDDFFVQTQAESLNTFNTIFGGITALLVAIAAISLIVGGVGIMNIMYVVVTERTAEIGLKKALGAKNSDILYEFLIEAVLVTVIGGAFGISGGAFLAWVVSIVAKANNLQWAFVVPFYAVFLGLGVAAAIGIIFGVLPARSASKLDPVEAMRYE